MDLSDIDRHEWASTDEYQDVVDCLQLVQLTLVNLDRLTDSAVIKSLSINLHNALSSACVALLTHTDGSGALQKDSQKRLWEYYDSAIGQLDEKFPELRVGSLIFMLKQLPGSLSIDIPKQWQPGLKGQKRSLWILIEMRNDFIHFKPQSWSIEKSGMMGVTVDALEQCAAMIAKDALYRRPRFHETNAQEICENCIRLAEKLKTWDQPFNSN